MSDAIEILPAERGQIRVFDLDMPPEQVRFLREPGALAQVLGTDDIDLDHVEIFPVQDLEGLGIAGYLVEGCGVPSAQVAPDRETLDAVTGHVLLIRSRAFRGEAARLTPANSITLLATYTEHQTDWSAQPLHSDSALPYSAPRPAPRDVRQRARRIGFAIFAIFMVLIVLGLWALVF